MSKSNKSTSSEPASSLSEPKDLGSYLKSLREQHNISLEQLSKQLKIRATNLDAIENNQELKHIPLAYTRGYIKNYCMFFGVDPDPILNNLPKSSPQDNIPKPVYNTGQAFLFSLAESRNGASRKSLLPSTPYKTILALAFFGCLVLFGLRFANLKKTSAETHNYVSHGLNKTRLQNKPEF